MQSSKSPIVSIAARATARSARQQTAILPPYHRAASALATGVSRIPTPRHPTRAMDSSILNSISRRSYYGWHGPPPSIFATRRAIWLLIGINSAVFGTWCYADYTENRKLHDKLADNTLLSWANLKAGRPWTLLTSAFTHKEPFHFIFNMVSLNAFGAALIGAAGVGVGSLNIFALGVGASMAGSAAWLYQQKTREPASSGRLRSWVRPVAEYRAANGASGMLMGFATAAALISPFWKMMILPIPIGIPMWLLTAGYMAYDTLYLNANDRIGRSAHLGGAVFGVVYYLVALRRFGGVSQLLRRGRH